VGIVGAAVAEVSATLLLYSEEGFLPALTLVLTLETGALGLGMLTSPRPGHDDFLFFMVATCWGCAEVQTHFGKSHIGRVYPLSPQIGTG
jgi:hypothetical protein